MVRDFLEPNRVVHPKIMPLKKLSDKLTRPDKDVVLEACDLIDDLLWKQSQLVSELQTIAAGYHTREPHRLDYSLDDDPDLKYEMDRNNWYRAENARRVLKKTGL